MLSNPCVPLSDNSRPVNVLRQVNLCHLELLVRSILSMQQETHEVNIWVQCSELWAPSVRKYSAVSDARGFLGTVFLDLYQRPGKYTTDAHFTLRCGRRLSKDEYRRPIVALSCSFLDPDATLSFSEVCCCGILTCCSFCM